jgi:hypothetical protein
MYDFPFREYSIQGRWPSPDPAGLAAVDPSNPQSWNRYSYVLNNPLGLIDPSGLNECAPGEHDCNWGLDEGNPGQDILGGGGLGGVIGTCGLDQGFQGGLCVGGVLIGIGFGGGGGGAGPVRTPGQSSGVPLPSPPISTPWPPNLWQIWGPFGPAIPCDFGACLPIGSPFTGQIGVSVGWTFWGINVNLFAGLAVDLHGHFAIYHGRGAGLATGARASGGVQFGGSNADTVCGLGGPFNNASGTLGVEGVAGTVDVFQGKGNGPGGVVTGGGLTLGVGGGASASATRTGTTVVPIGSAPCS